MPFPTNREIIESVLHLHRHQWKWKPDAVEEILAEIDRRVKRKPDIQMIGLMARVIRLHVEEKEDAS